MEIFKSIFGSRLYGTAIETSDTDYKFVFLPHGRDVLLQRAQKHQQQNTKASSSGTRNASTDVDCEGFSLQQWLHMVAEGQTLAVEMLFVPTQFQVGQAHSLWRDIQAERGRLISKSVSPFVGYCRAQAAKYCVKAERMSAARECFQALNKLPMHDRLEKHLDLLMSLSLSNPFIEIQSDRESHSDNWFSCCGRKTPLTATVERAFKLSYDLYESYGLRTLAATQGNVDWKALYHSLRIAKEAHELLTTGHITLPRPEAPLLLKIRKGELLYQEVSELIDAAVADVESALATTTLREKADQDWIDELVLMWHKNVAKPWLA